jgi:hypothetical protein
MRIHPKKRYFKHKGDVVVKLHEMHKSTLKPTGRFGRKGNVTNATRKVIQTLLSSTALNEDVDIDQLGEDEADAAPAAAAAADDDDDPRAALKSATQDKRSRTIAQVGKPYSLGDDGTRHLFKIGIINY